MQLVTERDDKATELGLSFNGSTPDFEGHATDRLLFPAGDFTHHTPNHRARNYRLPASAIREGWNEVLVFNGNRRASPTLKDRDGTVRILSVELAVSRPIPTD